MGSASTRTWLRQVGSARYCTYDEAAANCAEANRFGPEGCPRRRGRRLRVVAFGPGASAAAASEQASRAALAAAEHAESVVMVMAALTGHPPSVSTADI